MKIKDIVLMAAVATAALTGCNNKEDNKWQVLPDKDFYQSLEAEGAEAYEAIDTDGQRVGGAIIAIDAAKHHGGRRYGKLAPRTSTVATSTSTSTA